MQKLTVKQRKFADGLIAGGNATQAAIDAGYSKKYARQNANKLLQNTTISEYLKQRQDELTKKKIAGRTEILQYLSGVMRGEETESVATAKGIYSDVEVGAKDRVKAAELLGKHFAMWTEKRDITATVGPVQITDDIPEGSDDDG